MFRSWPIIALLALTAHLTAVDRAPVTLLEHLPAPAVPLVVDHDGNGIDSLAFLEAEGDGTADLVLFALEGLSLTEIVRYPVVGTIDPADAFPLEPGDGEGRRLLDLDGDGRREIALLTPGGDAVAIFDATSGEREGLVGLDVEAYGIGAADVDGDGLAEIIVRATGFDELTRRSHPTWLALVGGPPYALVARGEEGRSEILQDWRSDFDGDGAIDPVIVASDPGSPWGQPRRLLVRSLARGRERILYQREDSWAYGLTSARPTASASAAGPRHPGPAPAADRERATPLCLDEAVVWLEWAAPGSTVAWAPATEAATVAWPSGVRGDGTLSLAFAPLAGDERHQLVATVRRPGGADSQHGLVLDGSDWWWHETVTNLRSSELACTAPVATDGDLGLLVSRRDTGSWSQRLLVRSGDGWQTRWAASADTVVGSWSGGALGPVPLLGDQAPLWAVLDRDRIALREGSTERWLLDRTGDPLFYDRLLQPARLRGDSGRELVLVQWDLSTTRPPLLTIIEDGELPVPVRTFWLRISAGGQPVPDLLVVADPSALSTTTDEAGTCTITGLRPDRGETVHLMEAGNN